MTSVPIIAVDPAFLVDHTGIVGLIATPEPMSGRIAFRLVHIDELLPPVAAEDIIKAIVKAEVAVLKHARGAALLVACDISGSGSAMSLPLLSRYAPQHLRFIRWQGSDQHGRPGDPEQFGTSPNGVLAARVWTLARSKAFLDLDEVGANRLTIDKDLTDAQLAPLRKAATGTQTKQSAGGRILPATDQNSSDDVLSALALGIAIGQIGIDWNAVRRSMVPNTRRQSPPRSAAGWT